MVRKKSSCKKCVSYLEHNLVITQATWSSEDYHTSEETQSGGSIVNGECDKSSDQVEISFA